MISFDEAQERLKGVDVPARTEVVSTEEAVGYALDRTIEANEDVPRFRNAAMDGYAIRAEDVEHATPEDPVKLTRTGTVAAGDTADVTVSEGETVRIFTGAPVPDGATAVVMQEHVETRGDTVLFSDASRKTNIRESGEELRKGDVLFESRTVITPAATGMMMGQGLQNIPVVMPPDVAVVNTGDELVPPSQQPECGQIRDSIGPALVSALLNDRRRAERVHVPDDRETMSSRLERLLLSKDLVLISGGVSVGEKDLTREVLDDCSVQELFWKVHQKPGKPLYFGRRDDTFVLGLPGNPVSSLVCFYLYGVPLMRKLSGYPASRLDLPRAETEVRDSLTSKGDRTEFVRGNTVYRQGRYVTEVRSHQGSHMLSGLARANSLVQVAKGERNEHDPLYPVYFLPHRSGARGT